MRRNIAIVLAGGAGKRAGFDVPKQFVKLCGRSVLERAVDAFEENSAIDGVMIVSNAEYIEMTKALAAQNAWTKLTNIVKGGKERTDSTLAAISECRERDCNLIFHDAARALVSQRIISEVCDALERFEAVDVALPSTDSLISVDGELMDSSIERSKVWRVQTPQAFHRDVIARAYESAIRDPHFFATDDCAVVRKYLPQVKIFVVKGEEENIKLTYAADVARMEDLLKRKG